MSFPKSLTIFLHTSAIKNVTETGEVASTKSVDLDFIKLLTKGLGCSFKAYSVDSSDHIKGSLYIGDIPIIEEMHEYASYPYAATDVTFATEKPNFAMNTFAFLEPFTLNVWIGLLLCILLASLMHYFAFWRRISLMPTFFYVSGTLFGEHHNWRPKSLAQKVIVLSCTVGFMLISLSYGSVLLSSLTVPVREKGISDFDDLYEAVSRKEATALAFGGSGLEYVMSLSDNEKLRFLGEHISRQTKIKVKNALQSIKTNIAIVGTRNVLSVCFAGEKYTISQDSISLSYFAMYDATGRFCCMERVNEVIHWIWASGFNKKLYDDHVFKQRLGFIFKYKDMLTVQNPIRPLSIDDISGAFYFLVTGHVIGLICLLCEIFAHHYT